MWISTVLSFVLSACSFPFIIALCKRYRLYDPISARKIHSGNIPRLGGIGIVSAYYISLCVYSLILKRLSLLILLPIFISGIIIFAFGILDDLRAMPPVYKLIAQIIAACIVIYGGFEYRQIFGIILPRWISIPFTILWIIGIVNAYNLIDGLDGLCGGLVVLTTLTLFILFHKIANPIAGLFLLIAAAVFGFLLFNEPPAKIFMGDGGSQFLGFIVATAPLCFASEPFEFNKLLIMFVLISIPMLDTIAAIWRRVRDHRPIMTPDRAHLHHKLLNIGFTAKQAMITLVSIQAILCSAVCFTIYLNKTQSTVLLSIAYAFMIFFFSMIHFINRAVNKRRHPRSE
ncbi:MraY family glycosyltransferase [Treponema socranskii]|nr:MraY family glycosyltransferase [Treponema socranskii]